jgi:hypothetical protein
MHTHSLNKLKSFKQKLVRKLKITIFWDRKRSADGGIHETRDHNNVRIAL